jgi:cobyrinic acid a,c-diamide synthase
MTHLLISAAHKSSGKTTVAAGLCAALRIRGLAVQPFKKGPDYIDPMWLSLAAGRACRNLDYNTMTDAEITAAFIRHGGDAGLALIEGNKGLYDGLDLEGGNSNAALAALLGAPVVLVVDARGMTRGVAPLILGYQAFGSDMRIAGIILNKVGGERHESKLRAIIERYTDVPVLGALHRHPEMEIPERHLGLMPSAEFGNAGEKIEAIASIVARQVDLDRLIAVAETARIPGGEKLARKPAKRAARKTARLGVVRDSAFCFYYSEDFEALEAAGAELVPIDTLCDTGLPGIDGLFIGGGFPETHMTVLEANVALRDELRAAIEGGMPVYAECGGLMYLARSLTWRGATCEMVGAIPADVVTHDRPQGRGYVRLRETKSFPWPVTDGEPGPREIPAHEFHYSSLENIGDGVSFAYDVLRGHGVDGRRDGIVYKNLLASYAHLRDTDRSAWARRFVAFIHQCKWHCAPRAPGVTRLSDAGRERANRIEVAAPSGALRVFIVGAGPGDPDLLTVKALRLIENADVVVYDRLVSNEVLDLVPAGATRIFAGKAARNHHMPQEDINDLLLRIARSGRRVVRLKGGDPFVFGRGSEEAEYLARNGVSFEIVPGITASAGCAAYAGIPLTHRGVAKSVRFVTGHARAGAALDLDWKSLADPDTTLVIYMGLTNAKQISRSLIKAGLPGYTPAAAIERGTTRDQRTVLTTLGDLPDCLKDMAFTAPTLLVVGEVVELAQTLSWRLATVDCSLASI